MRACRSGGAPIILCPMMWVLYQILFAVGFAVMLPRFLWRMRRRGGYGAHFGERLGRYEPAVRDRLAGGGRIWIHAVSVGEVNVALSFIAEWRRRHSAARFVLSVTTPTGRGVAAGRMHEADVLIYFPVDFPPITRRAMDLIRPAALILVEGELWPNLIRRAAGAGVPVALINGRVSERSFRGYRKVGAFTRRVLPLFARLCMQGEADAERLRALGAPADRLRVMGSAKYELTPPPPQLEADARAFLAAVGFPADRLVLVGGSTWPGEEEALLELYRALRGEFPGLRLVLVPRHAERAPEVLRSLDASGVRFARRKQPPAPGSEPAEVALVDTTGELMGFYAAADVVFVGKSLTQHGGQNPIEPAWCGRPVICGPNMENFVPVMADFAAAGALIQVPDAAGLREAVRGLLADAARRAELGSRAGAFVRAQAGAMRRTADELEAAFGAAAGR